MKIHVNRIPYEGLREQVHYDPKLLDLERFDVHLDEPITLSSFVSTTQGELVVQADIAGKLTLSCARCLKTFDAPLQTSATLSYEVRLPSDVVDITEDVRQEIMLAYPMIPVCQLDCRGLCPICGANLNDATCVHQTR